MFTGIITDIGTVKYVTKGGDTRVEIETSYDTSTIDLGASIACAGACLTVIETGQDWFAIEASRETIDKTTLGRWQKGHRVNLERALKAGDELGGHIVTGHVDGLGEVLTISPDGDSIRIQFR
ncbi:MAG: riboflavin synthase, partial [Rhodospirillales bacterium]